MGAVAGGPRLVIQTQGYVPGSSLYFNQWFNVGLRALGDIDGDGFADLIVSNGRYPGALRAYSGQDGREIWQFEGRTVEGGYVVKDFALINDQNGDGIPEVFVGNDWTDKEAFILSGKDGSGIVRAEIDHLQMPIRTYDVDGDGSDDLVFLRGGLMDIIALAAHDLAQTVVVEDVLGLGKDVYQSWLLPAYPDLDEDGVEEYLFGVVEESGAQWVFVSGKNFEVLKRVPVGETGLASGTVTLVCAGDLDGDGEEDLVATKSIGARANRDVSFLGAVSGTDGSWLWQIAGDSLPGGVKLIRVDARTGERRELPGDVGFGERPAILDDLDGDGTHDIACVLTTELNGRQIPAILVFSGADGEHLFTLALPENAGRLQVDQLLYIAKFDPQGQPVLAVPGQAAKKKYFVAVFDLPRVAR